MKSCICARCPNHGRCPNEPGAGWPEGRRVARPECAKCTYSPCGYIYGHDCPGFRPKDEAPATDKDDCKNKTCPDSDGWRCLRGNPPECYEKPSEDKCPNPGKPCNDKACSHGTGNGICKYNIQDRTGKKPSAPATDKCPIDGFGCGTAQGDCKHCDRKKPDPQKPDDKCPRCNGEGKFPLVRSWWEICSLCHGTGNKVKLLSKEE